MSTSPKTAGIWTGEEVMFGIMSWLGGPQLAFRDPRLLSIAPGVCMRKAFQGRNKYFVSAIHGVNAAFPYPTWIFDLLSQRVTTKVRTGVTGVI